LLRTVMEPADFETSALQAFAELARGNGAAGDGAKGDGAGPSMSELAARLSIEVGGGGRAAADEVPARISFVRDANAIVVAALTDTAVVPERRSMADPSLLEEAIAEMVDPDPATLSRHSASLYRFLVPEDFRPILERQHAVTFEVDREMAAVPWEMLASRLDDSDGFDDADDSDATDESGRKLGTGPEPLALRAPVARQLRTTYSPPPGVARASRWPLHALVIGDPGDPAEGESLPGARREALEVARILREKGLEVTLLVGAPGADRADLPREVEPARRWDVLDALMSGDYDLLHYAGHGDFDPRDPSRTGWVFKGGLLTSRELERVGLSPALVVANACLSARTFRSIRSGERAGELPTEMDLLPSLADEFFRRGVRNYLGTAWEVNDVGAVEFARVFYDTLIPVPGTRPVESPTVGRALLQARKALRAQEAKFGALWAAYQHYGDPNHRVVLEVEDAPELDDGEPREATARGEERGRNGPRRGETDDDGRHDGTKNAISNIRGGRGKSARKGGAGKSARGGAVRKATANEGAVKRGAAKKGAAKKGAVRKGAARKGTAR
ncbi:MAG TPA: CHAT domain-containing protein, partial [Gemmatimonadales bacterium]